MSRSYDPESPDRVPAEEGLSGVGQNRKQPRRDAPKRHGAHARESSIPPSSLSPAPQVSGSEAGRAAKRGARNPRTWGIPAQPGDPGWVAVREVPGGGRVTASADPAARRRTLPTETRGLV